MQNPSSGQLVGVLLAAGRGRRFDPTARHDKLCQVLPDGRTVAGAAAANLLAAMSHVVAVVRPGEAPLARELARLGCEILTCDNAADGMAASLAAGLSHTAGAAGWVIALADMPCVQAATIDALVAAIGQGAGIAVPTYQGVRGNPVAFGAAYLPQLLQLDGDEGARSLLKKFAVTEIVVDDAGVRQDVDTPADLERLAS